MFDDATRWKLRFDTAKGKISTEDLWDLPLTSANNISLDGIAQALHKALKESGEKSFVVKKKKADYILSLKLDIVKHIIEFKLAENEANLDRAERKAQKEKLLTILADKEDDSLKDLSVKELKKRLKAL